MELARHLTSAIYLAVNTLCNQAAAADHKVMEKTYDPHVGDIELAHTEPACRFLNDPNGDDDWSDVIFSLVQQMKLTGTGLLWFPDLADPHAVPRECYVIPTATALPWPASPVYPRGSWLVQPYYSVGGFSTIPTYQNAAGARIPAEQIIRVNDTPHPILRYEGYAMLTAMQRIVDTIEAVDMARWTTQQRGVDPSVSIEFDPEILNPNQVDLVRLRQQIEAAAAGPQNAGKILFAPTGGKVGTLSHTPREMAWESGWDQLTSFFLAACGVPKGVAGLTDDSSYGTLFANLKQFYILSLCPLLRKIAGKITKHILRVYFGDNLYLSMVPERIDDRDLQETQLKTDLQAGIYKFDEWRKLRGLPPVGGAKGEEWVKAGGNGGGEDGVDGGQSPEGLLQRASPKGKREGAEEGGGVSEMDRAMERTRGRKRYDPDDLAAVLERAKTNGAAHPVDGYDDGSRAFLKVD